jgi:glycosyltransferase involved in cell wall biosynthesis
MVYKEEVIMETLKITMVSTCYPPHHSGGDAMHVYYLANALAKIGHEVDVICNLGLYELRSNKKKIREDQYSNHEGIRLHALKVPFERVSRVSLYAFGSYYPLTKQVLSIINSAKPDVVHHHNMGGLGISILDGGAPCVLYTAHDYWLICPMSSLMYAGKTFCSGNLNCFSCAIKSKRPVQLWRYYKSLKKKLVNIDRIITPSDYVRATLSKYNIPIGMETIYNFVPQPPEITEQVYDSPYFLFVGVLNPVKGIENLISAYIQICDQIEAHLLIVGDGPLKTKLREQITNSGKQDRIKLLGKVEYETLISLYKNTLATVIPSIWPENCPLVALESLSCGTPIIAANTGGLPEIVNISKAGILFEKDNVDDLSSRLLEFWSDNMKKYLQQNANSAYKNLFSPKSYLEKYQDLINKCMER